MAVKANAKIRIPLGDGTYLCAEQNFDHTYKEVSVYLENEEGVCLQDIVIAGEAYRYDKALETVPIHGRYNVLVFADNTTEDYTDAFQIEKYVEPKEYAKTFRYQAVSGTGGTQ